MKKIVSFSGRALLSIVVLISLTSCTSLFSGGKPFPAKINDRAEIAKAQNIINSAPFIMAPDGKRTVKVYTVAFDGTYNDKSNIPTDERKTVVAHIADYLQVDDYYVGAGMQNHQSNVFDAALGYSGPAVAEDARKAFFSRAKKWYAENPDTEVRVFVTGFSRGAATARRFMNLVTEQWSSSFSTPNPHFYAVLFDTVATAQQSSVSQQHYLSLPSSVDYLVHFIARDETRDMTFTPTVDQDPTPLADWQTSGTKRINTVVLPGAHSDIGTSYQTGIGDIYLTLTEQLLYMMGLSPTNHWVSHKDSLLAGKHDSRGLVDKYLGRQNPQCVLQVNRPVNIIRASALNQMQQQDITKRLQNMSIANGNRRAYTVTDSVITDNYRISLKPLQGGISWYAASDNIDPASITIVTEGEAATLLFNSRELYDKSGIQHIAKNSLKLTPYLLSHLRPQGSEVAFSLFENDGKTYLAYWVDNLLIELNGRPVCQ